AAESKPARFSRENQTHKHSGPAVRWPQEKDKSVCESLSLRTLDRAADGSGCVGLNLLTRHHRIQGILKIVLSLFGFLPALGIIIEGSHVNGLALLSEDIKMGCRLSAEDVRDF